MSLYREFDHVAPVLGADGTPFDYYERLRDEALASDKPIGWSERHGGFWVVSGWQAARDVYLDHNNISSRVVAHPQYQTSTGNRMILAEEDEPAHGLHRRLVNTPFSPGNAEKIAARRRSWIIAPPADLRARSGTCHTLEMWAGQRHVRSADGISPGWLTAGWTPMQALRSTA